MAAKYRPPRGLVESEAFRQDYDAVAEKYPQVLEVVGVLLWGIGENPLDFKLVPGHRKDGMRVAKSVPFQLGEDAKEVVVLRVFFVVPETGPIEIAYLDMEVGDPTETRS